MVNHYEIAQAVARHSQATIIDVDVMHNYTDGINHDLNSKNSQGEPMAAVHGY